ncbi:hypothetical protein POP72_009 [Pectobacterium phage POP72]|uniref:Uncharacterized protein n=2 Tax=Axomammavirus PP1 TaxID=2733578 RepID=I7F4W8_9CAUD|nr:hypothetical protein F486_gp08 [Pectobacterium phage PP1]AFP33671.1 hypothetical protein PP1_008 [Pectobacterium phage PP1]ARB10925.1 hypothetical protein POP72_009 [Pectobacterium phage POP72]
MTNQVNNTVAHEEIDAATATQPVRDLVAVEIRAHLDSIGTTYIKVGELLNEARADFENQKEFLAWADAEFSIKKAQCYNLMNVSRVFADNKAFEGVAMRVMLALVPYADDAELMTKAAELAQAGELDTAAVNTLTGKQKVTPPTTPQNTAAAGIAQAAAAAANAAAQENNDDTPPFSTDDGTQAPQTTPAANIVHAADASTSNQAVTLAPADERTAALLATIKQLNDTIADMQAKLNERTSERETRRSAAPMLPQFKSKCMYARLGLSAEDAEKKTAVNKAKRELVKLGYGEGHEAYALIVEAVEALTK